MTEAQNRSLLKVFPFVFLVALGLTGGGLYFAVFQFELLFHGRTATGEVLALEPSSSTSSSGRPTWFPIVSFETSDGTPVTFRHRTGSSPSLYAKGDKVRVTYLPDDPEKALLAEGFMNWLLPGILLLVGPVLAVISARGFAGARRRLAKREFETWSGRSTSV